MKASTKVLQHVAFALLRCSVLISLTSLLAAQIPTQTQPATPAATPASSLTVHISGLRNATGQLLVQLKRDGKAVEGRALAIDAKTLTAQTVFEDLPQGVYAVSLIHDENGNGRMDSSVFGVPVEGYGFSNNPRKGFGPPAYKKTTFPVNQPSSTLEIKLIYW